MTTIYDSSLPGTSGGGAPRASGETTRFIICALLSLVFYGLLLVPVVLSISREPLSIISWAVLIFAIWFGRLVAKAFVVAHVRGNGLRVSTSQLPHVLNAAQKACSRFGVELPEVYVVQYGKLRQALAEFFLSSKLVVLSSQLVDECGEGAELDFVLGREIGHIALQHHWWHFVLAPSAIVPLAYAAWRRATEYSADQCGLAVCGDLSAAQRAMLFSAVGGLAGKVEMSVYYADLPSSGGFWTTLRQLRAYHPDVNWRLARLVSAARPATSGPRRSIVAGVLCAFMPSINPQFRRLGPIGALAVIALLVSVLLPSLSMARQSARMSVNRADLRMYSIALQMYALENNGMLPPDLYTLERTGFISDSARQRGTYINYVPSRSCSMQQLGDPGQIMVLFCYGRNIEAAFLDGRVERLSDNEFRDALRYSRDAFQRVERVDVYRSYTSEAPAAQPSPSYGY